MTASVSHYIRDYVRRALTLGDLEEPESHRLNGDNELLASLYLAHRAGGVAAAKEAWEHIKRLRPEWVKYEPCRKLINADELKTLGKPQYLVDSYPFYAHALNVLVGPSGGGKSFVALDFCLQLIKLGLEVVYVAGEGLYGYAARYEVGKVHLSVDPNLVNNLKFYCEPVQITDDDSRQEFIDHIAFEGIHPDLIVIDTLARCAVGLEENSNKEMGEFVAALDLIRLQYDCAVLVVHHTGKDGSARGNCPLGSLRQRANASEG